MNMVKTEIVRRNSIKYIRVLLLPFNEILYFNVNDKNKCETDKLRIKYAAMFKKLEVINNA